jgi:hypothetical protein
MNSSPLIYSTTNSNTNRKSERPIVVFLVGDNNTIRGFYNNQFSAVPVGDNLVSSENCNYSSDSYLDLGDNDLKLKLKKKVSCFIQKEEDYYLLTNNELDIISAGTNPTDAISNFSKDFNYLYQRLNGLEDDQLSDRLQGIKKEINKYV